MSLLGEGWPAKKKNTMRREEDTERRVVTARPGNIRSETEIEATFLTAAVHDPSLTQQLANAACCEALISLNHNPSVF